MWKYRVPETGQEFTNLPSLESVIDAVWQHYRANGYSAPSREELTNRIEEYVCQRVPAYCGDPEAIAKEEAERGVPKDLRATFHTVMRGLSTMLRFAGSGWKKVDQSLAEKRAQVCVKCPKNISRVDCTNCNLSTIRDKIISMVGKSTTSVDERLLVCKICLCENKAKVHFPLSALLPSVIPEEKKELEAVRTSDGQPCWMISEQSIKKEAA
jgi:hypothetical protein